ncbi:hypothetical protein KDL45_11025 [bacterium]|nr:hypothetical protein [bacterium]MCB9476197.1 hypothetical protein [Deltaproteobacteria bacterium]MCB9479872.1 hypothetical protein [Deltaproteobacteria bacterium]
MYSRRVFPLAIAILLGAFWDLVAVYLSFVMVLLLLLTRRHWFPLPADEQIRRENKKTRCKGRVVDLPDDG